MKKSFVSPDFIPPTKLITSDFILRPLTTDDCQKDFEAVKNSLDYRGGEDIKVKSLTLDQNFINLARHQAEFSQKTAFTYSVLSLDQKICLGCVYINPPSRGDFDSEVWIWVRKEFIDNIDQKLFLAVKNWLTQLWPFKKVAFPGREIDWPAWDNLKYEN